MCFLRTWLWGILGLSTLLAGIVPPACAADRSAILAHIDSLHIQGQVSAAEDYIAPLLATARSEQDSAFMLPLTAKLGRLWASFGQSPRGKPLLLEAESLALALGDSLALCDARRWLGYTLEQLGLPDQARRNYLDMLAAATARGDRRHQGWALVGLAFGDYRSGRDADAIARYKQAIDLFKADHDTQAEIWALNGLGMVLNQTGHWSAAREIYTQVGNTARKIGYLAAEALAENNLGKVEFGQGNQLLALGHFQTAFAIQTKLSQWGPAVTAGTNIADCIMQLGRFEEAANQLHDMLDLCDRKQLPMARSHVLNQLGRVLILQGRPRQAAASFSAVLDIPLGAVTPFHLAEAVVGLADALTAQGESEAALDSLLAFDHRHGADLKGESRIQLDLSLGRHLAQSGHSGEALPVNRHALKLARAANLPRYELAALAGLAECERSLDHPDSALGFLQAAVPAWEGMRGREADPVWREQVGPLSRRLATPLARLVFEEASDPRTGAERAFNSIQVFKARTLAERLIHQGDAAENRIGLPDFQRTVLKTGEVFLDAWLGPQESLLFTVTTDTCLMTTMPALDEASRRIRLLRDLAGSPSRPEASHSLADGAAKLGTELFGPIIPLLQGANHIVVAADGPLNLAPLPILLPGVRASLSLVPSAAILAALRRVDADIEEASVAALAGLSAPDGRTLAGTAKEVASIARKYRRVTVYAASDLDPRLGLPAGAHADILHLAAHAKIDDQRPWSSSLQLGADETHDPVASGIALWRGCPALVILSGCDTATGMVLSGEGVMGLSSAFLASGARTVVATLWPIDDAVTTAFMDHFYRSLAEGATVAAALGMARDKLRSDPTTADPFYWSGFAVIGDGTAVVRPSLRQSRHTALGGGVFLVLVLVLLVFAKLRAGSRR